jgi:glycerol-3-phosphate acyltransferase PlsY
MPFISFLITKNILITLIFILLSIISFCRHESNIRRILRGEEPKIKII